MSGDKVIEILSGRFNFDFIYEKAHDVYCLLHLSVSQKFALAHYSLGGRRRMDFFKSSIPVFTHYTTDLYREMMLRGRDYCFDDSRYVELLEKWKKHPEYVVIGCNPKLEVKKVFDLEVKNEDGQESLSYVELLPSGERRKITS